jgi:hypothetical protein
MKKFFEATTSDKDILKQQILREIIFLRAEELMEGKRALPVESINTLELKMMMPKSTRFDPEIIAEGALSGYQMLEWFETTNTMRKEQVRVKITDESVARMQADIQTRMSVEAAARGLAWSRDTDIFTVLAAGAAHNDSAVKVWTDPTADIITDISKALDIMLTDTYLVESDLRNINLFYPLGLMGYLTRPLGEGFMPGQTVKGFIQDQYGVTFIGTRQLTTTALLVVNSPETARHVVYSGSAIPTTETQRLPGIGQQYIFTQYYKTFVMPEAENGTTNHRIYKITGANS